MSKQELRKRLEAVQEKKFMNEMVDGWTSENYRLDKELREEIKKIKEEIAKLDKGE